MGTRYEQDDYVFSGDELGEVLKVENPESDSPTYHVNFLNRKQQPPEHMKASELRKADLNGYHPDTLEDLFDEEIRDAAHRELVTSESSELRINRENRDKKIRLAKSHGWVGINGMAMEGLSYEKAMREQGYDPQNWERDSGRGGRIPTREVEIQVYYVIENVQKETGIDHETLDMIFNQKYDPYSDVMYTTTSGQSSEFVKVNQ